MKKQILSLSLVAITILAQAQSANYWRTSGGNTPSSGEYLGTSNATDILFKTNNVTRLTLDANGNFKLASLVGSGNRFLQTDANGNLSALSGTNLSTFFNTNNLGVLQKVGSDYYLPTGNLGIGIAPSPAFKLDVIGDARISNNLYVGGGIVITDQVHAATQVKGLDFKVDNSLAVAGASSFTGTANFKGALQNTALAGAGISKVYSNAQGVIFRGPYVPPTWECVSGTPNWNIGGNNFNSIGLAGVPDANIGTCDDADFILKSNNNPKIWLKNTGGNEYVGFGTSSPSQKFHFSGGNTLFNDNVGIGSTTPVLGFKLNVVGQLNQIANCFESTHNANYGYNTKVVVNRDLTKAFAVFNTTTGSAVESFRVYGNGQTQIGTQTQVGTHSDALLTVFGKMVSTSCFIRTYSWADYVFANDYKLPNLYDVEKYYLANKHLPEIPSEKEVLENGIDVAQMNKLLLKKIEEMTILMVKQQKDIDALKEKVK